MVTAEHAPGLDDVEPAPAGAGGSLPPLDPNAVSAADADPGRQYRFMRIALAESFPGATPAVVTLRQTWSAMLNCVDRPHIANAFWRLHVGHLEVAMGRTGSPERLTEKP